MSYPTFTTRDGITRCDRCGVTVRNRWRDKTAHRCIHTTQEGTPA